MTVEARFYSQQNHIIDNYNPSQILPLPCSHPSITLHVTTTHAAGSRHHLPLRSSQIRRSKQWRYPYISVGSKFGRRHACWGLPPSPLLRSQERSSALIQTIAINLFRRNYFAPDDGFTQIYSFYRVRREVTYKTLQRVP